jgi:hypothetical protein
MATDPYAAFAKPTQPSAKAASEQTIRDAEAEFAKVQRRADAIKKQADANITVATSADQIRENRAKADKAELDLQTAKINLDRLRASAIPLSEGQGKAANFFRRTLSSNLEINRLGLDPDSMIGQFGYQNAPSLTHAVSSDERNAYRSAVENFIAATLRLESGAAIGKDEFERQYRIYFPQAGAGPEEVAQKRKARELAINGLKAEAGPGARQAELDLAAQGYEIPGINEKEQRPTNEAAKGQVAGAGAETTTAEVPKELQAAMIEYVNTKGKNLNAQDFQAFFNNVAKKLNYPGQLTAEEAKSNVDAILGGARYGGVNAPERPLTAAERGVNEALLSIPGAVAAGAFNATTMGIPAMMSEDIGRSTEGVREERPEAYIPGEIAGSLAMTGLGGAGLKAVGMGAPKAEMLSDLIYSGVTGATGAPEGDRLSGAATNMLFSGMGAAAPSVVKRVLKPNPDEDIKILREAGVRLTPAQTIGGRANQMEEAASRLLLGGGDIGIAARKRAFNDFGTAYLNQAGKYIGFQLPNDLKPHARMKTIGEAFDNQYDTIRAQMSVAPDQDLLDDIANLETQIKDGVTFSPENATRLQKLLDDQLKRRTANPIGGDEYKDLQSLLKKRRASFSRSGNQEMADGVENMQAILDNAARRRSPPEVVDALNNTDRGFALLAQAQEAAKMAGNRPGEFSPAQILSRQRAADTRNRSRSFVEGDMEGQRLAEAGQNVLGNVLPSSGTTERLAAGLTVTGGGALLSPWSALPNAAIGLANAPVVRDVLPAVFAGKRPAPINAIGELMDKYKVPLRYLGSEAGRQFSPSDQTPEDYAMTRMKQLSPTAGAAAVPDQMRVSALPAPQPAAEVEAAPKAQTIRIRGANGTIHEIVYDESTDTYLEPKTGRRVKNTEDITRPPPEAMYRGGLMDLARKYR